MDKRIAPKKPKKYKRSERKLSDVSLNLELASIREDDPNSEEGGSPAPRAELSRSPEGRFIRMAIPEHQEGDSDFLEDEHSRRDMSVVNRPAPLKAPKPQQTLRNLLQENPEPESGRPARFVKVYDPQSIFQEFPDNKMMLLYPFILSKHYVDFLKHNNIFPRSLRQMMNSESSELGTGSKSQGLSMPRVEEPGPFDVLTEAQKCQKFSKKLRRAWNLNHRVTQNVFKRVALVYKNPQDSGASSLSRPDSPRGRLDLEANPDSKNMGDHFNCRQTPEAGSSLRRAQKKRGPLRRNKPRLELGPSESGRNLRKTTRIKKKIEKERLLRQEKYKQKHSRDLLQEFGEAKGVGGGGKLAGGMRPGLVIDKRRLEKVEFLDYTNKVIRKKKRGDGDGDGEDDSEDEHL